MNLRLTCVCCLAGSMVLCASTEVLAIGITAPSWKPRETIAVNKSDIVGHVGADRTLAYDHHGGAGVVYFDATSSEAIFARRTPGVGWTSIAVSGHFLAGRYPSIAFDRHELPALSYFNSDNNEANYALFNGATWDIEFVDSPSHTEGTFTSIAFDILGQPGIAYRDETSTTLKFVRDTNGDLSLGLPDIPVHVEGLSSNEGTHATLTFDQLNRPLIAHYDVVNGNLRYSIEETDTGWSTTTVDSANNTGLYPSIDVDPDTGFPAIAYYDSDATSLRFAQWNGSIWDKTTIDGTVDDVGLYPSLAFDPRDGNPAIAYFDDTNKDLKLAWHDGASWQTQTVDGIGDVGYTPSLAFNDFGTGFPSIVYFEETGTFDTVYFIDDPPSAVPDPTSVAILILGSVLLTRRPACHSL